MKRLFVLLAGAFLFASLADLSAQTETQAHTSTPAVKTALTLVITKQLSAFQAGDFTRAYSFAAAEIQKMFPPDQFRSMVRSSYPIMLEKVTTDFGVALDDGQDGVVFLELTGERGTQISRYTLKSEAGAWKISGVEQVENVPTKKPNVI